MWTCDDVVFDASVRVCAPVLVRGRSQPGHVRRWRGRAAAETSPARWSGERTWSHLLQRVDSPPAVHLDGRARLGGLATATAGFRDQFYGLAPHVVDRCEADDRTFPPLVTCGAIDLFHCAWGERPTRYAGRRWLHPRVDLERIDKQPLRRWVDDRLVPKVVLATQTKVLEAVVDVEGTWVPSTPVVAVHAAADELYRVAAVLLAPPVSAWALANYGGVALTSDAIKLSARQVLEIPLPSGRAEWGLAAAALEGGDVREAARCMVEAYRCHDDVFEWWANR
jgi:hypothetical protein